MDLLSKLKDSLSKTRQGLVSRIQGALGDGSLDGETLERLEEALVASDVGVQASTEIIARLKDVVRMEGISGEREVVGVLRRTVAGLLRPYQGALTLPDGMAVILVVGINGVGKTTTIAKITHRLQSQGRNVVLAASDTFRAAAAEQLDTWAKRAGAIIVSHKAGGDPAAVAFDAIQAARARGADTVIVDTAGRLHTRVNLMEELKKVRRILAREVDGAPHEVLLVLDATTGQNALEQAKVFKEAVQVTGICMTKLDGTSRGGIILAVTRATGIPVKFVGVGEGIEDLREFSADEFAGALL